MALGNGEYAAYILAAAAAAAGLYAWYLTWKSRITSELFPAARVREALVPVSRRGTRAKAALVFACIGLAALVLMRPQWGEREDEARIEGVDVLAALDVSRSMDARDTRPSRLGRAKNAVRMIAESARGGRVGLVLFAGDAYLQCPLTSDIDAFLMFLDSVDTGSVRRQGTDLGRALDAAAGVFERRRLTSRILILITDGEDHEGGVDRGIERMKGLGVMVYTVGVGTESGENLALPGMSVRSKKSVPTLEKIAEKTGGEYLDITESLSDMKTIIGALGGQERTERGKRLVSRKIDRYQIFALLLAVLLSIEAFIPERRRSKGKGDKEMTGDR
jgi:Ca-activated chloride channel homolog